MAEQLKNIYTQNYILCLANEIKKQYTSFQTQNFIDSIFDSTWNSLELKARMRHIALKLNEFLPLDYKKQLEILKPVSKDFFSYESMFFQDFVEVFGLHDFNNSMKALEIFTIDSSSEFAIRQFILKYEDKTLEKMKLWAKSENEHLRRLASEGCRPRLPWAIALIKYKKDPSKVLEILELLKNDKSLYVRKSVANNLNDISKDNPYLVIEFVKKNLGITKELDWICKHGSRTLLKKGIKEILELFDYGKVEHIKVSNFIVDENIKMGENLNFTFDLESNKALGKLRVEYIIEYLKANGSYSKKIFMIAQNEINENIKNFRKKQSFKNMTTRKHYKGKHFIAIILNGQELVKKGFIVYDASN